MRLQTVADIPAPPETLWRELLDFSAYEQWNPFVVKAMSEDRRRVTAHLDLSPHERYFAVDARIDKAHAPYLFTSTLLLGLPGLAGGHYGFRIEDSAGMSRLSQEVRLTGLMRGMCVSRSFLAKVERGMRAMGAALQERFAN